MRRALVVTASLLLLAGCGQQAASRSDADPSASATSSPSADAAASQPWLLRFDSYLGEDGEARKATYVSVVPSTGATTVVAMPEIQPVQVSETGVSLLVDAGHRWALADNRPLTKAQRTQGIVRLFDLSQGGGVRPISVRRISGDPTLHTDWVSFDPATPNLLRVVSGRQVWKVDVATQQAQMEGTLPEQTGWIYGGGFSKNTGEPYIEDTGSFDTLPAGNGDDDTTPVERAGGSVLDPQGEKPYGDEPDPCEVSAGFVSSGSDTWAFCVSGTTLQTKVLDKGASSWRDVGTATGDVVPRDADPVFALPPA